MDCEDSDYDKMSHDELLALADTDSLAAEAFYYRYQYSDDPVLKAEVHGVLRSLAEEFEHSGFWPDWYAALRDSGNPKEQREAEGWRKRILDEGVFDKAALIAFGVLDAEDLSHDELLAIAGDNMATAAAFFYRYRHSHDPAIKAEVHAVLKLLAVDFGLMGFWLPWYVELRDSDNPSERQEAEVWKAKIIAENLYDKEVLIAYNLVDDSKTSE